VVTVKQIQLPQPLAESPTAPARPRAPRIKPDKRVGEFVPRHPALNWRPMPYMDDFLTELQVRERKPDYIRMVKVGLSHLATYLAEKENIRHPEEIDRSHLVRFQGWVQTEARTSDGQPFSIGYQRKLMCYVRSWIRWLVEADHIEAADTPWRRMKVVRTPKQPKPLLRDEIAALFEAHRRQAFSGMSPFAWHRQEVILVLLYAWGLRIHELQSLNLAQLDLRRDVVHIKNKGSQRPKPLPYTDVIKQTIQRYLVWRATEAEPGEQALLVEHTHGGRCSIARIYKIIVELGDRAGVTVNPHRLRDSFGTTMVNSGAEIEHVQVMMGHSEREMTMAYVELADERVVQTHREKMGPILESLMGDPQGLPEGIDEPPAGWPRLAEGSAEPIAANQDLVAAHERGEHEGDEHTDCTMCWDEAQWARP